MSEAVERLRPGREASRRRRLESGAVDGYEGLPGYHDPHGRAKRVAQMPPGATVQPNLTERVAFAIGGTDPDSGLTHRELANIGYDLGESEPTASQLSAVRRCVARLVRDGRAERGNRNRRGARGWGAVAIHRPLTPVEREAKRQADERFVRAYQDRLEARRRATPYPIDTGIGIESVMVEPVLVIRADGVELRQPQERDREHAPGARLARVLGSRGRG